MASPPYSYSPSALSPPYPSHSQLPSLNTSMTSKKRSITGDALTPSIKRRKASTMSITSTSSAHPLRQTSFPPDDSPFGARSPSIDFDNASLVSGSAVSSAVGQPPRKKRGRKSKAEKAREQTPSVAPTAISGVSGAGSGAGRDKNNAAAEGADDEDEQVEMGVTKNERTKEEREEERRLRFMLLSQMDKDQHERYEVWHAAKFSDAVIKRVVNATVSQSVPNNIAHAVKSAAKVFIGDLLEQARRVQVEWVAKTGEKQSDVPPPEWPYDEDEHWPGGENGAKVGNPKVKPTEPPRGPLRPDHLREAWRRYNTGVEGGSVGRLGLWHVQQQSGVERFAVRAGGRRLFK
ncbi:Transcription initiation factor TFIID subunit 11 [Pleurostoma richardsiae]|uniref:Transcription initiation factor TFIID subunit 11 n=1 Tax=Pleurostoma richardsiae TaxID=41990 RepID=A0AA38RDW7_9PEZI|nr:Transcription initiation factor TFIID subunit 11 [Pleurostoma richardsiae]